MPFINVNNQKIFYFDNRLEGIPLVFIHGWLGTSLEWRYQLFHFNFKNHIILLDLPGFGKSDKPNEDYSIEFFTNQLLDFVRLLGYKEIILVGHSLGGLIAQNIAFNTPNLVKKLILISSTSNIFQSIRERFIVFWVNILFKLFYKSSLKNIIGKIISPEVEIREFNKLYNSTLKLPKMVVLSTFKNMTYKYKIKKNLFTISQPTLLIFGSNDKIISKSNINELNKFIPNSELLVIENGSHRTMYNNYSRVNEAIERFIQNKI
ncbi:MAG: alpha/beta fold hydrolase [Candidatus Hermodarchaeota archaeon]